MTASGVPEHIPVMTAEVLQHLQPERGGLFVDCTVGLGGHARAILEAGATRLIGLDRDQEALAHAGAALGPWAPRVELVHSDYRDIDAVLETCHISQVDGALADLGVSSMQFDELGRGFSFQRDEPLDMRMDRSGGDTAAALISRADERELADTIYAFGEERFSRRIARAIVEARREAPIDTTAKLAAIVRRAIPVRGYQRIDPASWKGSTHSSARWPDGCVSARGSSSSRFTHSRTASSSTRFAPWKKVRTR